MRILMLSWEYPPRVIGGLAQHVAEISRALVQEGNEVKVITAYDEHSPAWEEDEGVEVYRVPPYHGRPLNFLSWVHQLNFSMLEKGVQLCRQEDFDLVHAHDWLVAYAARALKHIFHLPLIATIHATEYGRNGGLHNDEQRYISDVEWWLTYESWRVICCSQYMREELERVFQLPGDKIRVIYNGIRPQAFQVSGKDPAVRDRYAAPGEKILFFIGRLVREKGVQVLLEALPLLRDRFPVRLVVAGKGPYEEELHRLARQLGVDGQVAFAGFVDDYTRNQLYAQAEVAVFPSLYEPFGLVALEAMAAGTPVVVGNCGGFMETVQQGVNGLRAAVGDPVDLARQISLLLEDRELAAKIARRALADVAEKFSWTILARQTEALYRKVVFSPEARRWRRELAPSPPQAGEGRPFMESAPAPPSRYEREEKVPVS
ncbi:MAG: glycosyltransferase family 4 protein [Dethiobacteria bacterium]